MRFDWEANQSYMLDCIVQIEVFYTWQCLSQGFTFTKGCMRCTLSLSRGWQFPYQMQDTEHKLVEELLTSLTITW